VNVCLPMINEKRVLALGMGSSRRAAALPDLPTTVELGVPDSDYNFWVGMFAPAGTPRDIVVRLNQEINNAIRQPNVSDKLSAAGLTVVTEPPEYFASFLKADYEKYGKLVKDIGFTPQ
jgi:tripartite-type tricarboxylate transporter receptor subunit TctC